MIGHEAESINVEGMNGTLVSEDVQEESHERRTREDRFALRATDGHEVDLATYIGRPRKAVGYAAKT